ncbi:uncharacterized protein BXZ73DRAFT_101062 [Epithele typhae]|uniref:uncharacterized protein n=1 Tax=Epithele typhae TaxID=378194 RepID=UPI00200887E0|nr:uncharacterized protein BXZ73DRAFT_101062 [Epithele typhae]KAH9933677.1 hypothetical protein BXZ73DRAFT_101062 [Epithele typhae]
MSLAPAPKHRCTSCGRLFKPSAYTKHLKYTRRAVGKALRQQQFESDSEISNDNPPELPQQFQGDLYGDYDDYDWDNYRSSESGDPIVLDDVLQLPELIDDLDDNLDDEDAENFKAERRWEHPPPVQDQHNGGGEHSDDGFNSDSSEDVTSRQADWQVQRTARDSLKTTTHIVSSPPDSLAGTPVHQQRQRSSYEVTQDAFEDDDEQNPYAPFVSFIDCAVAMWAKMWGPSSTAVSELLQIDGLASTLGLSFRNSRELNKIIDEQLPSPRPRFIRQEVLIGDQVFEFFYRDVIECIRALYGDPEFSGLLVFAPERHYADADHTIRVYFDMHTGKWWWATQEALDRVKAGGTIIPIIISSDKTQLTVFGNKTAYPVYLTIGNLPKHIRRKPSRRGQILLAYLPSTRLEHVTNKASRRRMNANLYHACMAQVLKPLRTAGIDGVNMASGDGIMRRGHPILAVHAGDYPEQLLTSCCKSGDCPKCAIDWNNIGASTDPNRPLRNLPEVLEALSVADTGTAAEFGSACRNARIKPVTHPYWLHLPFVNIFRSITPDILHQLHQGVVKHVISWIISAYGADEIDAHCRRFPPNHHIRLFMKGISTLQRVMGKEHAGSLRTQHIHRIPSLFSKTLFGVDINQEALRIHLPFNKFPAYHKIKLVLKDAQGIGVMEAVQDVIHARPQRQDKRGRVVPGRFDTVLVEDGGDEAGVQGQVVCGLFSPYQKL